MRACSRVASRVFSGAGAVEDSASVFVDGSMFVGGVSSTAGSVAAGTSGSGFLSASVILLAVVMADASKRNSWCDESRK